MSNLLFPFSIFVKISGDTMTGALTVMNLKLDTNTLSSISGAINLTPLAGQNLNISLSTTGDLVVNTNQLYVDTSTGNVGIGTTGPLDTLHVHTGTDANCRLTLGSALGGGYSGAMIQSVNDANSLVNMMVLRANPLVITGNVGIGTTTPTTILSYTEAGEILQVSGAANTRATISGTESGLDLIDSNGTANQRWFNIDHDGGKVALRTLDDVGSSIGYNFLVFDNSNGNVGIGTTAPTNLLSLGGNAARIFWMERHTTANTAGNTLTITAGGATSGATDKAGGALILQGGLSTGSAESGVTIQGCVAGASGTADRTQTTAIQVLGNKIGIFSTTPVVQQNTIVDADGTLADITTKFNTLLASLEAYGWLKSA